MPVKMLKSKGRAAGLGQERGVRSCKIKQADKWLEACGLKLSMGWISLHWLGPPSEGYRSGPV